ncbi:MAG: hypothetical protein MN733_06300 [Nitrososphaera sp.]|nr:hypothetical protein [Nitrososphaera sp.]
MSTRKREMVVTVNFEPNRMEEENLKAAYELIMPIVERVEAKTKRNKTKTDLFEKIDQMQIFTAAVGQ